MTSTANKLVAALLILVGVIHLLPVTGVVGAGQLESLYGITAQEPNLEILLRHRAVLFALLGSFLIYAAFKPRLQPTALLGGLISVISFIAIAWSVGEYNDAIRRVFLADVVAVAALVLAAVLFAIDRQKAS